MTNQDQQPKLDRQGERDRQSKSNKQPSIMEYNMTTTSHDGVDDTMSFGIDSTSIFGFELSTYRPSPPITFLDSAINSTATPTHDCSLLDGEQCQADMLQDDSDFYYFPYECIIAAISVAFFRMTIKSNTEEPLLLRIFFALSLGCLAYLKKPYEMIHAIEVFSYAVPYILVTANVQNLLERVSSWLFAVPSKEESSSVSEKTNGSATSSSSSSLKEENNSGSSSSAATTSNLSSVQMILVRLCLIACSAVISLIISHVVHSDSFIPMIQSYVPMYIQNGILYMIPIVEMQQAYDTISIFVDPNILRQQFASLLFVTFHIQCAMGYLGIDFLIKEQKRRNELIRLDDIEDDASDSDANQNDNDNEHGAISSSPPVKKNKAKGNGTEKENDSSKNSVLAKQEVGDKDSDAQGDSTKTSSTRKTNKKKLRAATRFQKGATPFILFTAIPYMFQIITFGNVNFFAYHCFEHDIKRSVRLNYLFAHDSHLVTLSKDTTTYGSPNGTYTIIQFLLLLLLLSWEEDSSSSLLCLYVHVCVIYYLYRIAFLQTYITNDCCSHIPDFTHSLSLSLSAIK